MHMDLCQQIRTNLRFFAAGETGTVGSLMAAWLRFETLLERKAACEHSKYI